MLYVWYWIDRVEHCGITLCYGALDCSEQVRSLALDCGEQVRSLAFWCGAEADYGNW